VKPGDAPIFELLDPFCRLVDSVAHRDEEVGDSSVVFDIPVGGAFKYVFVVFDPIVESGDLLLEATDFDIFKSVASGDGCKEPFGDGSEDVGVEVRVCCQGGRNSIGRHRWFQTLDRADQERDAVLSG
jgi:hypothetical protein